MISQKQKQSLRQKTAPELLKKEEELIKELALWQSKVALSQEKNTSLLKKIKAEIAIIKTILLEKTKKY